jgi:hypothetical protein
MPEDIQPPVTPPAAPPVTPPADPPADPTVPPVTPPVDPSAPVVPPIDPATPPAAPVVPVVPVVPDKYELKLPAESTLDPAIVERTAAKARELGLSNEAGQQLLDSVVAEVTARETAQAEANKPGGSAWTERVQALEAAALADKEIGGSPEKLAASAELGKRVLAKFFPPETAAFLQETGLGSHPAILKGLAKIGRSMSEGSLAFSGTNEGGPPSEDEKLARMYPSMFKKE